MAGAATGREAREAVLWMLLCVVSLLLPACSFERTVTQSPRTATEQLLLSEAVNRSLADLTIPLPEGASVTVEPTGFTVPPTALLPVDLDYVRAAVSGRIGELGFHVRERGQGATYLARVVVQSLGTIQGHTFVGMPPVQSILIPVSLPELTLYKRQVQRSHMRFWIDLYEAETGRFIRSTPWHIGSAYYHQYTVLFLIQFNTTDLIEPP